MPRSRNKKAPTRRQITCLEKSCLQLLPDSIFAPEDPSSMQASANSSFALTNNACIAEPIENGAAAEPMQINQKVSNVEKPVQLEIEVADEARGATVETCAIPADQVARAQRRIASAKEADETEQRRAIEDAIQLLYPYPPRQGQRDALWQLIYQREDLILTAKTSFGKSMIYRQYQF